VKQPARLHYAGIDWATRTHAVCVVDQTGAVRARFQVPNTGRSFAGLCKRLAKLGVAGVAIERPTGRWSRPWWTTGDLAHLARRGGLRPGQAPRGGEAAGCLNPSPTPKGLT
jgi:hypothetical protein